MKFETKTVIGWIMVAMILFALNVKAQDSAGIEYPGDGKVLLFLHAQMPTDMSAAVCGVQQDYTQNHGAYTDTVGGIQGIYHSDVGGCRFSSWDDAQSLIDGGIIIRPINWTKIGRRDLSRFPVCLRKMLAPIIGYVRKLQFERALQTFIGKPYDYVFTLGTDAIYCYELFYQAWKLTGSRVNLFPTGEAQTMAGWNVLVFPDVTWGMVFMSEPTNMTPDQLVTVPQFWDTDLIEVVGE
jgi:hypothetical protein